MQIHGNVPCFKLDFIFNLWFSNQISLALKYRLQTLAQTGIAEVSVNIKKAYIESPV